MVFLKIVTLPNLHLFTCMCGNWRGMHVKGRVKRQHVKIASFTVWVPGISALPRMEPLPGEVLNQLVSQLPLLREILINSFISLSFIFQLCYFTLITGCIFFLSRILIIKLVEANVNEL